MTRKTFTPLNYQRHGRFNRSFPDNSPFRFIYFGWDVIWRVLKAGRTSSTVCPRHLCAGASLGPFNLTRRYRCLISPLFSWKTAWSQLSSLLQFWVMAFSLKLLICPICNTHCCFRATRLLGFCFYWYRPQTWVSGRHGIWTRNL